MMNRRSIKINIDLGNAVKNIEFSNEPELKEIERLKIYISKLETEYEHKNHQYE